MKPLPPPFDPNDTFTVWLQGRYERVASELAKAKHWRDIRLFSQRASNLRNLYNKWNKRLKSQSHMQNAEEILVVEVDKTIELAKQELRTTTVTEQALAVLKEKWGSFTVNGITDMEGYKLAKAGVSELRSLRTSVEARRKALTEPALKFQRELIAAANAIVGEIEPLEKHLKEVVAGIDNAKLAAERQLVADRIKQFTEHGYSPVGEFFVCGPVQVHASELPKLKEEQFAAYLKHGAEEVARRAAEAERQRVEAERLAAERAENERIRAENERMREELEAQRRALEESYGKAVAPQPTQAELDAARMQGSPLNITVETAPASQAEPTSVDLVAPQYQSFNQQPEPPVPGFDNAAFEQANLEATQTLLTQRYNEGFDAFRTMLVTLVDDTTTPLTRATLRAWAVELPYPA